MPDSPSFVINDRRKFTVDGELRHDAPAPSSPIPPVSTTQAPTATEDRPSQGTATAAEPDLAELADSPESDAFAAFEPTDDQLAQGEYSDAVEDFPEDALAPGPTADQVEEATRAYDATVDRLDTAMRAANPGGERLPKMTFERLVQSLYTQALLLLGGGAQPGETPRVDILGARETIDMLSVMASKSEGNLSPGEDKLLQSALFDLRMGFLEITQALARQASQRQTAPGAPGLGGMAAGGGPRIVR